MGMIIIPFRQAHRRILILLITLATFGATFLAVQILAAEGVFLAADLNGSSKSVDKSNTTAGSSLQYTIVVSNSGNSTTRVVLTDRLPISVTFQSITTPIGSSYIDEGYGVSNGVVTMTGLLGADSFATLNFTAVLTDNVSPGQIITNTVEITGAGSLVSRSAGTLVVSQPPTKTLYVPVIFKSPPKLGIRSSAPDSSNSWTVSWDDGGSTITGYELEESQVPNFSSKTTYSIGAGTLAKIFQNSLSFRNVYYYRVRAVASQNYGPWSSVLIVVGGYLDEFDDSSSGWAIRRMSFLEKTFAKYGTGAESGNLIMLIDDKWDWAVASPLVPAPPLPYAIEYRSRVHDWANLVSGGGVFGGDWNGGSCPEVGNVYQTTNCFNHFYNMNTIWFGPLKNLFERVDNLSFCPTCGGPLVKRESDDYSTWLVQDPVNNANSTSWNTWRIEVRSNGIKFFINGQPFSQKPSSSDTRWVNEPYFGVFASSNEYKPSIWFFDYFKVTALDN